MAGGRTSTEPRATTCSCACRRARSCTTTRAVSCWPICEPPARPRWWRGADAAGAATRASRRRRARRPAAPNRGRPGEARRLRLSLQLLADVGLVGFPNAGKSTLLRAHLGRAAARRRLSVHDAVPSLGVARVGERRFVLADMPGLIEGASEGARLGDRFLRHVERTRVLVHLVDVERRSRTATRSPTTTRSAASSAAYDPTLRERTEIVALNKIDLLAEPATRSTRSRRRCARAAACVRASGATGEGMPELLRAIGRAPSRRRRARPGHGRDTRGPDA